MKQWFKKLTVHLMLLSVTAMCFTGVACGDNGGQSNKTIIKVANYSGGVGMSWLDEVEQRFEEEYKDYVNEEDGHVGVDLQIFHDKGYLGTTLASSLGSDTNDVYFTQQLPYRNLASTNALLDITDLVSAENAKDGGKSILSKFYDEQIDGLKVNGKYYAIPHYEVFQGIIYDAGLFASKKLFFSDAMETSGAYVGTRKFINDANDKKSCGPDGKYDTYDDGLPSSIKEFEKLINEMTTSKNVTPFVFPGKSSFYTNMLLTGVASNYIGTDGLKLMLNFGDGVESGKNVLEVYEDNTHKSVEITVENGYLVKQASGIYYALELAQKVFKDSKNYPTTCTSPSVSNIDAHDYFICGGIDGYSDYIGMLIDGNYWYNEALEEGLIANAEKRYPDGYAKKDFRFMPMPVQYDGTVTENNGKAPVLVDDYASYCFINANISKEKIEIAKELLAFCYRDAELNAFTVATNGIGKSVKYDIESAFSKINNSYAKSLVDIRKAAADNDSIIRWISTNPIFLNNETEFTMSRTEFWDSHIGGTGYSLIYTAARQNKDAKSYFDGMSIKNKWAQISAVK